MRSVFSDADDTKATELLRIETEECETPLDIDVLELLQGLKKYPESDEDTENETPIFTRCVKYCVENNVSWCLSKIQILAQALEEGREPRFEEQECGDEVDARDTVMHEGSGEVGTVELD